MDNKIYSFIGLARKANKILSGEETCEKAIRAGKVKLVIAARDSSQNTKKKFENMCQYKNIEIKYFGEKALLGKCLGKEIRSVVAVTDEGFANRLAEMIEEYL